MNLTFEQIATQQGVKTDALRIKLRRKGDNAPFDKNAVPTPSQMAILDGGKPSTTPPRTIRTTGGARKTATRPAIKQPDNAWMPDLPSVALWSACAATSINFYKTAGAQGVIWGVMFTLTVEGTRRIQAKKTISLAVANDQNYGVILEQYEAQRATKMFALRSAIVFAVILLWPNGFATYTAIAEHSPALVTEQITVPLFGQFGYADLMARTISILLCGIEVAALNSIRLKNG